jgi:hypothetical protein
MYASRYQFNVAIRMKHRCRPRRVSRADFEEVSGKRERATLHRRLSTSERTANILRDYFGTFRAVSGLLALFRSHLAERRLRGLSA